MNLHEKARTLSGHLTLTAVRRLSFCMRVIYYSQMTLFLYARNLLQSDEFNFFYMRVIYCGQMASRESFNDC